MNLDRSCQLVGWVLFIICSIFYLISGIHSQDSLVIWGSLLFLIACLVFMFPLMVYLISSFHSKKDSSNG
ncbi:hypothetical protein [Anoxynatronum buryatiense]|uniref:hypothetical protein n=1 Tax=Anoxynatronum buryatiense TaxID=489973 RepID=UPI0024B6A8E9|nr:hypothetical protein [Anoxynatronum buryatiense]